MYLFAHVSHRKGSYYNISAAFLSSSRSPFKKKYGFKETKKCVWKEYFRAVRESAKLLYLSDSQGGHVKSLIKDSVAKFFGEHIPPREQVAAG